MPRLSKIIPNKKGLLSVKLFGSCFEKSKSPRTEDLSHEKKKEKRGPLLSIKSLFNRDRDPYVVVYYNIL